MTGVEFNDFTLVAYRARENYSLKCQLKLVATEFLRSFYCGIKRKCSFNYVSQSSTERQLKRVNANEIG